MTSYTICIRTGAVPRRLWLAALFVAICSLASAQGAEPAKAKRGGPRTTVEEFFAKHIDTSIPGLAQIPAKMAAGDRAGAEKAFADYVRSILRHDLLNRNWIEARRTPGEMGWLKRQAEATMDYRITSCKTTHQFEKGKVDWFANPTFNAYKEWTWQLSRHIFLTRLAEYYTATGDERAARTYVNMIDSWINQAIVPLHNKPQSTLCWRSIETGIRMYGWSRQIAAFAKSPAVTDGFLTRYFISVWEHGRRLRTCNWRGNWLLMEMHGLIRIAMLYPFLTDAQDWKEYALGRLKEEFSRQVYPDGFQYELSTSYHGVVVDNYQDVFDLYDQLGLERPEFIRQGLENMYDVYLRLMRPDRQTPALNDGRNVDAIERMRRAILLYPGREDFQWVATEGREGRMPAYLSCALPYSGAVVFRTSWERDAVWAYMDCSPFGHGHQHEDKLNFLLFAYGKEMLTEGGNYLYDSSECRKYVISTRSHNTVRIGGEDQKNRISYRWEDDEIRKPADLTFSTTPAHDLARAEYISGYGPPEARNRIGVCTLAEADVDRTRHERTAEFFKAEPGLAPFFVITDRFFAPDTKARAWEAMWHLETSTLTIGDAAFTADFGDGIGLAACVSDRSAKMVDMKGQKEPYFQGWMPILAGGPHEQRPIPTPVVQGTFTGSYRVVTVLYPYRGGTCPVKEVRAAADPAADACTLVLADGTERVLQLNAQSPKQAGTP